jgi:hypothetical protein
VEGGEQQEEKEDEGDEGRIGGVDVWWWFDMPE